MLCESTDSATDSLIQLHFNIDNSFLAASLLTNENDVTFENMPVGLKMTEPLIDMSCCLRMKLDFVSRQVWKVARDRYECNG